MNPQTSFAELVRDRREALSMTQSVLAGAAGVTERTVQRVEKGESPSQETVMALCSVLGIAPTTAHSTLRHAPPLRQGSFDAQARVPSFLPPAPGPRSEAERSLAIAKLVRSGTDFEAIAATDLTALAHDLVTEEMLRRQGMAWNDAGCEEQVVDLAVRRSADNPLRNLIARMNGERETQPLSLLIVFVVIAFTIASVSIVLKHNLGPAWGSIFMAAAAVAWIVAMLAWLPETDLEKAKRRLAQDWVIGIARDRVVISKVGTNGLDVLETREIVSSSLVRRGAHLRWEYRTFDGEDHALEYIPAVPEIEAAFQRIDGEVRNLAARSAAYTPDRALPFRTA